MSAAGAPDGTIAHLNNANSTTSGKFETIAKHLQNLFKTARRWALNREISEEQTTGGYTFLTKFGGSDSQSNAEQQPRFRRIRLGGWQTIRQFIVGPVNPDSNLFYYWSAVIALIVLYNAIVMIARYAFDELQTKYENVWLVVDYSTDILMVVDMFIDSKRMYLCDGLLVSDTSKSAARYLKSANFIVDVLSILPTDLLDLYIASTNPWLRLNRVLRYRRMIEFGDRTDIRTNSPNVFRILKMAGIIVFVFHCNACVYFSISKSYGMGVDRWVFGYRKIQDVSYNCQVNLTLLDEMAMSRGSSVRRKGFKVPIMSNCDGLIPFSNLTKQYLLSFYFSALTLATIGNQPRPFTDFQYFYVVTCITIGMLIQATIVGSVGSMIANMGQTESEFTERLDGVKRYMQQRAVGQKLKKRIVDWFGYIWSQKQTCSEEEILNFLPVKLKTELAMQVHLDTLKRVKIFQDCEPGLLIELVLKLQLQVYSPNDYICRKGDVGKEMYIVKRGSLNVVSPDGKIVFVTLKEGSVFGELSVLNIPGNKTGNKRSASVRSVGYSDLFVLSKDDLWDALREYPETRKILLEKGREMLRKDNLLDESVDPNVVEVRNLDQKFANIQEKARKLQETLRQFGAQFDQSTKDAKRRVTLLEKTYQEKQKIY